MADALKFIYGTEAQILALTPDSEYSFEKGFYYQSDKTYFYQAVGTVLKKYGDTATEEGPEVVAPVPNIIANAGVGLPNQAPPIGGLNVGDIYVTTDFFKILIVNSEGAWDEEDLQEAQFVTDVSNGTELPPLYQYYDHRLMPIANYAPDGPPEGLQTLPE